MAELEFILESEGFEIQTASDGERGLDLFSAAPFDVVLSDIVMPGIAGYEVCRRIKAHTAGRDVPVILLTSLTNPEDIIEGLDCGADNFITKPYEADYLLARIRTVLANKSMRQGRKLHVGVTLSLLGRAVNITSEKEQILDLLISTFEEYLRLKERENERRVAEETLRRSFGLVQSALNALPSHVVVLDEEGTVVAMNSSWQAFSDAGYLFGAPCDLGDNYLATCEAVSGVCAGVGSEVARGVRAVIAGVQEAFALEYDCPATDSRSFVVRARPFDDSGRTRAVVVHEDVSDFRRAEEALIRRDAILESVSFAAEQFMIVADLENAMQHVLERLGRAARVGKVYLHENSLAETGEVIASFRYEWTERGGVRHVENPWLQRFVYRERGFGRWEEVLGSGGVVQGNLDDAPESEREILAGLGMRSFLTVPIFVGPVWWGSFGFSDLEGHREWSPAEVEAVRTAARILGGALARRQSEEALRQSEEQLRQSQKMEAIGRLAGGIAHDFNNLLTVIGGYSDIIIRRLPEGDRNRPDAVEIRDAGHRAAQLTHQLLAFSRKQVLEPRTLDLNERVARVEQMLQRLLGEDIELSARLGPNLWAVQADPGQIEQILMNLAVNARDAMPDGGRLTIETSNVMLDEEQLDRQFDARPGPHVLLSVSDTGCGMDEETLSQIFEPFFTTKELGKGTGLGLSTVYGIVKQSAGSIVVSSEPGHGTVFQIFLPQATSAVESALPVSVPNERTGGTETVLVVEDEDALRRLVKLALEQVGYSVVAASDGAEALRILEQEQSRIDLVVTDLVMPRVGGREVVRSLAERFPNVKALYMSGYSERAATLHEYRGEGAGFLEKPFTPDALVRKVREVLDQAFVGATGIRGIQP